MLFDKHVGLCEEYVKRALLGLSELFGSGPSKQALQFANDLYTIRQKHAPWVPREVYERLEPFEGALRAVGAGAGLLESLPVGPERSVQVEKVWAKFSQVIGMPLNNATLKQEFEIEDFVIKDAIARVAPAAHPRS